MTKQALRLIFHAIRLTIFVFLLAACGGNGRTWERIQQTGVLRIGLDPTYPPFELLEGERYTGLDIDLANALAAELGVTAEFRPYSYDALYDALATGQVDVLISALRVEPEKMRDFAYSNAYFNAGELLVLPVASSLERMADLDGRLLAVELGAQGHVEASGWARKLPNLTLLPYNTADAALTAVAGGSADAALVDAISGRLFIKATPGLKLAPEPVTVEPYALVVRIDDATLLKNLNDALDNLNDNGRLEQIMTKWLGN